MLFLPVTKSQLIAFILQVRVFSWMTGIKILLWQMKTNCDVNFLLRYRLVLCSQKNINACYFKEKGKCLLYKTNANV